MEPFTTKQHLYVWLILTAFPVGMMIGVNLEWICSLLFPDIKLGH